MYHTRKKSGHGSANTSMTDVRKASSMTADGSKHKSRPAMARRSTPQSSSKPGKSPRERERERQETWDDDEDSFPQFCTTCDKQFVTNDYRCLYCSEACRKHDQESYQPKLAYKASHRQYGGYSLYPPEPRDIIPRASPSRPSSTHYSAPMTPEAASYHTSAVSALRSLNLGPSSPPSPNWFSRSAATSPGTSYKRGASSYLSSTYDGGYEDAATYGYKYSSSGMDRPLPSRRPEVSSRPKSIELVTPMVGR